MYTFVDFEIATDAKLNANRPSVLTQSGVIKVTPVANTATMVNVTFPTAFPSAPVVVPTAYSSAVGDLVKGVGVTNVTATGCQLWVYRTNTTNTTIAWQAWGMGVGSFVNGTPARATDLNAATTSPQRIVSGQSFITPSAANTPTSKAITFGSAFAATPVVVVTMATSVPGTALMAGATGVGTGGFTAWICRSNTTSTYFNWIALGRM